MNRRWTHARRTGWGGPERSATAEESKAKRLYAAALKRIQVGKKKGPSVVERVGQFDPRVESFASWQVRFREAQRSPYPQPPPEAA